MAHRAREKGGLLKKPSKKGVSIACFGTKFITLSSNTPKIEGLSQALGSHTPISFDDAKLLEKLKSQTTKALESILNPILDELYAAALLNFSALRNN